MTTVAQLLGEFIAAWNAGRRPRIEPYLERLPPPEREELAEQIETFLMIAPEPTYDEQTWAEMVTDPVVVSVAEQSMAQAPKPLPALRERAGLTLQALAERLGFTSTPQRAKAERYLAEIEAGQREPRPRLLERLAHALGVAPDQIGRGAGPIVTGAPALGVPRAAPGAEADERVDVLADALLSDDEDWDAVDELFLGE
jgi:transcriptional regulator with XRE-family HTH domain